MAADERASRTSTEPQASSDDTSEHDSARPGVVVWNQASRKTIDIDIRLLDGDEDVVFRRALTVPPGEVVPVRVGLQRGVYRVDVQSDRFPTASQECLIGGGVLERAFVEIGTGGIRVVEGF